MVKRIFLILLLLEVSLFSFSKDIEKAIFYGEKILDCQYPDGGINMKESREIYMVPYFSHFAAEGLIGLYSVTKKSKYLKAVKRWLEWYIKHLNEDYTVYDYKGYYPSYICTYYYDSTDSYAAGFLFVLWYYYDVSGDLKTLKEFYPYAKKVLKAIELTLSPDGLTFVKPDMKIRFLMDNIEVYQGLDAMLRITKIMKDKEMEDYVDKLIKRNLEGIKSYWCDEGFFGNEITAEGNKKRDYNTVYPGGLVNIMFYDLMLDKEDIKSKEFVERLFKKFIYNDNLYKIDSTMMFWWAIAAYKKGDKNLGDKLKGYIEENLPIFDYVYTYGHYVRALLYEHSEAVRKAFNLYNFKLDEVIMSEAEVKRERLEFRDGEAFIDDFKTRKEYITSGWAGWQLIYDFVKMDGKDSLKIEYSLPSIQSYAQLMITYPGVADLSGAKSIEFEVKGFKGCTEEIMITIIENDGDWWTFTPDNKILKTGDWEKISYPIENFERDIWSVGGDKIFDIKNIKGIRIQINRKEGTSAKKGTIYLGGIKVTTRESLSGKVSKKESITPITKKGEFEYLIDDFKPGIYNYATDSYLGDIKYKFEGKLGEIDAETKTFGDYVIFKAYSKRNLNLNDINGKIILEVKVSDKLLDSLQFSILDNDGDIWDYFIDEILNPGDWYKFEIPVILMGRNPWSVGNGIKNLENISGYKIQLNHNRWNRGSNKNKIYIKPIKFISTENINITNVIFEIPEAVKNPAFLIDNFESDTGWDLFSYKSAFDIAITGKNNLKGLSKSLEIKYRLDNKDGYIELTKKLDRYMKISEMKQFYSFESSQNICIFTKGESSNNERLGIQLIDFDGDIWYFIIEDAFKSSEWVLRKIPLIRFVRSEYSQGNNILDIDKIKEVKLQIIYGGKDNGEHYGKFYLSQFYLE